MYLTNEELLSINGGYIGMSTLFGKQLLKLGIALGNKIRYLIDAISL